ncbi:endolytic transglycosylase MltG [Taibaiella sp. KBW10]|uniref:endolytic transglycosylase MltG n=1 Tax=Taibaiella sp. KBW10 TaxID=2153357 RepID=UPI000F59A99C|nr:endolytic transglycosylase MltG [Taibaiella sp. KBW10]RQO32351.1 endolytic transglycosylase MltG [Taibaiella sp. KBW10]
MNKKLLIGILALILVGVAAYFYMQRYSNNVAQKGYLYIPTGARFEQILDSAKPLLKDLGGFERLAKSKGIDHNFYPGRYSLKPGMSNTEIVSMIQQGKQDEIAIRIGNYSSISELAGKMAPFLEADSAQIIQSIAGASFTRGLDTPAMLYFFMPNTYNFHWNTSGPEFTEKMKKEFDKFWTEERKQKAQGANMTPLQVTTLASIVQLESAKEDEQAKVAGLYLNRLRIGMKLDADPTIIFIKKMQSGFSTKISRVYYNDLKIASPYNTYINKGLPPSPICMPNPSAIDAVLNPVKHEYLYFVADPQKPGYHWYAKTLAEQEKNAAVYRAWLDKNNIK